MTTQQSPEFIAAVHSLRLNDPAAPAQIEALAKAGDGDALMMLGEFRLIGIHGPRNFAKGLKLISAAADKGQINAQRAHIYLTAAGIGRKPNRALAVSMLGRLAKSDRFAALQLGLLDHVQCLQKVDAIEPEIISADPYIAVWRGLFNKAEYTYLRHVAAPHLKPAAIVDSHTGGGVLDSVRDSSTSSVPMIEEDLIVQDICAAIASATDSKARQGEQLAVLHYSPGQQYRPHYDAYPDGYSSPQRLKTALIWLNDDFTGGETHFPRLDIAVRGQPGDMLVFTNTLADGSRDDRMEHAGLPVTSGEKWLASRWITDADLLDLPAYG